MIFRFITRYLLNNQQLIDRVAESYPIRRAAQLVVYFLSKTKSVTAQHNLSKEAIDSNLKRLKEKLENELKK